MYTLFQGDENMTIINAKNTRKRLGGIVKNIFTEDFAYKYHFIAKNLNQDPALIMNKYKSQTNDFVELLSNNLLDCISLSKIIKESDDYVAFCFFLRYNLFTQYLTNEGSSNMFSVSSEENEFFKQVFLDYWQSGLSM